MSVEAGTSDFIHRVRQRHQGAAPRQPSARRSFIVHISRDGRSTEALVFDTAPNIGAIAARAGTEAFVISLDVIEHPEEDHLAAE